MKMNVVPCLNKDDDDDDNDDDEERLKAQTDIHNKF